MNHVNKKTKYYTHVEPKLLLIEAWARDGCIDKDIALKLGIAYSTFREYVAKHSALSAILKKGKEVADIEVENALFKRAVGYECEETVVDVDEFGGVRKRRVKKKLPPDVAAIVFWLKNRLPNKWRDRAETKLNAENNETRPINIIFRDTGNKDEGN